MQTVMSERTRTLSATQGPNDAVRNWLDRFAQCVRDRDFDAGRAMFAADVTSFGTWTGRMDGVDTLIARQWQNVWPGTCGFHFDLDTAAGDVAEDSQSAWAAATWTSFALNADGSQGFKRSGRATFAFRRDNGRLVAVHSHFSLDPSGRL